MEIALFQYHSFTSFPPNGRNLVMNLIKIPSHFDREKVYVDEVGAYMRGASICWTLRYLKEGPPRISSANTEFPLPNKLEYAVRLIYTHTHTHYIYIYIIYTYTHKIVSSPGDIAAQWFTLVMAHITHCMHYPHVTQCTTFESQYHRSWLLRTCAYELW